jgi:hypothetical protein
MHSTISPRATRDRLIKDISGHCPGTHGLGGRARKKIVTRPKRSGISSMRSTTVDDVPGRTHKRNQHQSWFVNHLLPCQILHDTIIRSTSDNAMRVMMSVEFLSVRATCPDRTSKITYTRIAIDLASPPARSSRARGVKR